MPLIQCPSCSAQLNAKDELAGRRIKCPKCATPIDVPAAGPPPLPPPTPPSGPVPARVVKRPAAAPPSEPEAPASLSFDDDEPPPPRKSRRDEDDVDDRPKKRSKAVRDEDDEDEKPRKKKSNTLLFLGIGGAVLFVLCGGCGFGIYRAMIKVGDDLDSLAEKNERVTQDNAMKLRAGMPKNEVETILGPGKRQDPFSFGFLHNDKTPASERFAVDYPQYWSPWVQRNLVIWWRHYDYYILVAFDNPPDEGGKIKGVAYSVKDTDGSTIHNEIIKLPRTRGDADATRLGIALPARDTPVDPEPTPPKTTTPPKTAPTPPKTAPASPKVDFEVTALGILNEFIANAKTADAKYRGKTVRITGTVRATAPSGSLTLVGKTEDSKAYQVVLLFPVTKREGLTNVKTNASITVVGTVGTFIASSKSKSTSLTLSDCQLAP